MSFLAKLHALHLAANAIFHPAAVEATTGQTNGNYFLPDGSPGYVRDKRLTDRIAKGDHWAQATDRVTHPKFADKFSFTDAQKDFTSKNSDRTHMLLGWAHSDSSDPAKFWTEQAQTVMRTVDGSVIVGTGILGVASLFDGLDPDSEMDAFISACDARYAASIALKNPPNVALAQSGIPLAIVPDLGAVVAA